MPRITLPGTLEVSLPRLGTIRATSCVNKRPKHLHQRRNTVPEFVQIQSQHNLNFAGPHQRGEFVQIGDNTDILFPASRTA